MGRGDLASLSPSYGTKDKRRPVLAASFNLAEVGPPLPRPALCADRIALRLCEILE